MIICDLKCYDPKIYNGYLVPCGQSYACKLKRSNDWQFRLKQEYINHNYRCLFVTFTYDDESLHVVPKPDYISPEDRLAFFKANYPVDDGIAVLFKRDIQLFNKRARHDLPPFTYFIVGEYGPTTLRPHYHALYFGLDMSSYDKISELWKFGFIKADLVSPGRIAYVSKYSLLPCEIPEFYRNKEYKPFMICSKGLGIQYLQNPQTVAMHQNNDILFVNDNGYKKSLPRYYRNKVFSEDKQVQFADEYKQKTREMLDEFYSLEMDPDLCERTTKRKKDWVEQHRYHVEEKMLKKSKL